MKQIYKFYFVVLFFSISFSALFAQHYTPENTGTNPIKSSYMLDVLIDNSGNTWLCTAYGLTKHDGTNYTNFTVADGILPGRIAVAFEDANNNIWFGTSTGISKFNGTSFTNYTTADGLIYDPINCIFQDNNGDMWFGTASDWQGNLGGISKFDGTVWTNYTSTTTTLPHNEVHSIAQEGANMWFGTKTGLAKFDGSTWTAYTTTNGLIDDNINSITGDNSNNIWIGTNQGVSKFDGTNFTNYTTTNGLSDNKVNDIYVDGTDIIFGTASGMTKFDGTQWSVITYPNLASDEVTSMHKGNSGDGIIGSKLGAARHDGTNWTEFSTDDSGMINCNAYAMLFDNTGNMWSSGNDGISRFDGTNWTAYNKKDGLNNNYYWSMIKDASGNIWMQNTTGSDVVKYDGNSFTTIPLPSRYEECSYLAPNGDLWFGAFELAGGAIKYDGSNWTVYNDPLIQSGQVYSIADDASGNVYFATNNGVIVYNGSTYSAFNVLPSGTYITEIFRDSHNNLWFTSANTYYQYDGTNLTTYTNLNDGISSGYCQDIVEDASGRIIFGTKKSVDMFNYNNNSWTTFDSTDGLPDGRIYSLALDPNGKLWIGYSNDKGIYGHSLPVGNNNIKNRLDVISIAPNPTDGLFQITNQTENINIEISTIQGQVIWNKSFDQATTIDINLKDHSNGMYFVTAKSKKGIQTIKLIKE